MDKNIVCAFVCHSRRGGVANHMISTAIFGKMNKNSSKTGGEVM